MKKIRVTVDTHLRVEDEIPDTVRGALGGALIFANPEDEEEIISMIDTDDEGRVTFPRGFIVRLRKGMASFGYEVEFDDRRRYIPWPGGLADHQDVEVRFPLRDYQEKAVGRMLHAQQCIYEAPTGSGKTITCAAFIARSRARTIIIVDKANLATQWQDRLREAIGVEAAIIGDGQWEEGDVTIALRQSLWARRYDLDEAGWWDQWGAVILDECHAISAETVRELIQRFPAYYRIGVSATPDRHNWLGHVSRSMIGEIACRTSEDDLMRAGVLVKPNVHVVKSPLTFPWSDRADHRRQWQQLLVTMKNDGARNRRIMEIMQHLKGRCVLVHTEQTSHADILESYAHAAGWPAGSVFQFTGRQSNDERQEIIARAAQGDCMLISTIGKEALDIPRLDAVIVVWPTKNDTAITQIIGRIMRTHPEKTEPPEVYDIWDQNVRVLNKHFMARRGVYERRKLKLNLI